jgi:hypothetical protein
MITGQREGMGLLEYQAMPSLPDVAYDGGDCVHLQNNSSWKFFQLAAGQLLVRATGTVRKRPSIT